MKVKLKADEKEYTVIDIDSARGSIAEGKACVFQHPKRGLQFGKSGKVYDLVHDKDYAVTEKDPEPPTEPGTKGLKPAKADVIPPKDEKSGKSSKK